MSITKLFLMVIRAFVRNEQIEQQLKPHFTQEAIEALFAIAKAHDVVQIVSDVLFKSNLLPKGEPITEKYQKSQMNALYRYMNIEREQQRIYELFENEGIEFIPLKGAVIRQYYPDPYMRTSCDIDILVREDDLSRAVQALVAHLNYKSNDTIDFHDISLFSQSGVHLELHYNLKEKRENLDKLLIQVWDYSVNLENSHYHKLETPEFYIFHHIAHMVNHFLRGGCGIRTFIDLYFIEKRFEYNRSDLNALLKESGVETFYNTARQCVSVWFDDGQTTESVDLIELFVLKGGVYGTKANRISVDQTKQGGKVKYFLSRIFVPYDTLKYKYPVLQKHKVLLPFMWFVRIISFVSPQNRKRAQNELQLHKNISDTAEKQTERMIKLLEI